MAGKVHVITVDRTGKARISYASEMELVATDFTESVKQSVLNELSRR